MCARARLVGPHLSSEPNLLEDLDIHTRRFHAHGPAAHPGRLVALCVGDALEHRQRLVGVVLCFGLVDRLAHDSAGSRPGEPPDATSTRTQANEERPRAVKRLQRLPRAQVH